MALLSRVRALAGAAALAALAGACELTHPPTYVPPDEDQLVVVAVLHAGSDSAAVLVVRVGRDDGEPPAVSGARVRVAGPGGTGVLAELTGAAAPCDRNTLPPAPPIPTGCYVGVVPGGVLAGAEYRLEVDVSTGGRARGRTVVPPHPVIHAPAETLRVRGERTGEAFTWLAPPIPMRWTAEGPVALAGWVGRTWAAEAAEPECHVGLQGMDAPPLHEGGDSLLARVYLTACQTGPEEPLLRPDSAEVLVDVTAFDSATIAYMRQGHAGKGIPQADASTGLEGAFGLFGSAAASRRRILFVTAPED